MSDQNQNKRNSKLVRAKSGSPDYKTQIKVNAHTFYADEPESLGGLDAGPNPLELLMSSLGACTVITLRMYAKRKMWSLSDVEVFVSEIQHEGSEETADHTFQREIIVKGDLTKPEIDRLLEIANSCPIHKILTGSVAVESSISHSN